MIFNLWDISVYAIKYPSGNQVKAQVPGGRH